MSQKFDGRSSPMLTFLQTKGIDFSKKGHCSFKLESKGYMPLTVEYWTENGLLKVSVAHYYYQEGDAMRDPEILYRVTPDGQELPEFYQQDNLGLYQEAIYQSDEGKTMLMPKLIKDLQSFTKTWVGNLREQGHELTKSELADEN